jgi:hypothetical protein
MDIPTRVGLGGTALFTLAGVSAPVVSWWVSAPIMALCTSVALWGFWPAMVGRLPIISMSFFKGHALDRISIVELLKMATDRGWNFTGDGSLHLIDLQDAIRQGASDDHLTVWGRLKRWNSEELLKNEILEKIPQEHWQTFYVHLFSALQDDNFNTKSWTPSNTPANYLDLHVTRREASVWLDRDAVVFRGKRNQKSKGIP